VAEYVCPECGERHSVGGEMRLDPPPGRRGTVAELYPRRDLWPMPIRGLMTKWAVWCDQATL
jgi:hypothetical protein